MLAYLDFDEFHDLLLDATRDLLLSLKHKYHNRAILEFMLTHDPLWGFMVPRWSIREGIDLLPADIFKPKNWFKEITRLSQLFLSEIAMNLRQTIAYVYHPDKIFKSLNSVGREYFEEVNMWLLRAQFYAVRFEYFELMQYHRTMTAICVEVLQTLDKRGLFGDEATRDQTIVNVVMMKDPDREWIKNAQLLNSPQAFQTWFENLPRQDRLD